MTGSRTQSIVGLQTTGKQPQTPCKVRVRKVTEGHMQQHREVTKAHGQ